MTTNESCREVRELLAAFHDDELPCERSRGIQEHLDACDGCRAFSRMERGFTGAMRARLGRLEAPDSLVRQVRDGWNRIDRGLDAEPPSGGTTPAAKSFWSRMASSRTAWGMAAAILAALLLAPAASIYVPGAFQDTIDSLTGMQRVSGVLVCIECERHGAPIEAQKHCHAQGHQTGLKCAKTGLWHFVADDASWRLLSDPGMRGERVVVEGRFLSDIHYIDVRSVTVAPGT